MSNTRFNQGDVEQQAVRHTQQANAVGRKVDSVYNTVTGTAQSSPSKMTGAAARIAEVWRESVKKAVTQEMEDMATKMRQAVADQVSVDETSAANQKNVGLPL